MPLLRLALFLWCTNIYCFQSYVLMILFIPVTVLSALWTSGEVYQFHFFVDSSRLSACSVILLALEWDIMSSMDPFSQTPGYKELHLHPNLQNICKTELQV